MPAAAATRIPSTTSAAFHRTETRSAASGACVLWTAPSKCTATRRHPRTSSTRCKSSSRWPSRPDEANLALRGGGGGEREERDRHVEAQAVLVDESVMAFHRAHV